MSTRPIRWERNKESCFTQATIDGIPLVTLGTRGLLSARVQIMREEEKAPILADAACPKVLGQALEVTLTHHLGEEKSTGAATLVASLTLNNHSERALTLNVEFMSSARPSPSLVEVHLPLTANGSARHPALVDLGNNQLIESRHLLLPTTSFTAHYLEPLLTEDETYETKAQLLIPLVTLGEPGLPWALSLFATPERPWRIAHDCDNRGKTHWSFRTRVHLKPGETVRENAFLHVHDSSPASGRAAFHRLAHHESHPPIAWLREVRGHYYDFLSALQPGGVRGKGYDANAAYFKAFRIGLATQHGYYPYWGDYLDRQRTDWLAMAGDVRGAVPMSLQEMRRRVALTRVQGARSAIFLHLSGFDDKSPLWPRLRDSCRVDRNGEPIPYPWDGPDIAGTARFMSIAAGTWSDHLLGQARLIFELLDPDAIVMDETFAGLGYDFHPMRRGAISNAAILFMKQLRTLARSFGPDKAILTSDCGLAAFSLWADGEAGDHAYPSILGHPEYRREPVRYLAALGDKPWLASAWLWRSEWENQVDLTRKTGAAIGFGDGWLDFSGFRLLTADARARYERDLKALSGLPRTKEKGSVA